KYAFRGCSIQAKKVAKMVTRSCHCQNFVSINLFTINGVNGVSGVSWYFVCSMLHLQAAIKTIPGRASFHFYFPQNSNRLMARAMAGTAILSGMARPEAIPRRTAW